MAKTSNDKWSNVRTYKSHQELADDLGLRMDDPFTRVCIAVLYWHAQALYWRQKAKEKDK